MHRQSPTRAAAAPFALAVAALVGLVVSGVALVRSTGPTPRADVDAALAGERVAAAAPPLVEPRPVLRPERARRTPPAPPATARPATVRIPAVGYAASVRPVGVANDGQMALPPRPTRLGWYRFGPAPGAERGAAVIAGHLDSRRFGLGPLVRLREVEVGDRVAVQDARGRQLAYAVTGVRRFDRQALPAQLFARTGRPRLHLITCGGAYDPSAGGYQVNLVVTAEPV